MQPPSSTVTATTGTPRLPRWLECSWPAFVLCAGGAHNLYILWNKWGDLFIDYGRELLIPLGMLQGKVLYRDMRYYYGPLSNYLNALLFKIFGVHLLVLVFAGVFCAAILTFLLYRIARFWLSRLDATVVCLAFIYISSISKYNYYSIFNFATPYTYSAVYGITLAVASLYFLITHYIEQQAWTFFVSMLLCAATFFCKIELAFAAASVQLVFLGSRIIGRSTRSVHWFSWLSGAALVTVVYCILYWKLGPDLWSENIFNQTNERTHFYFADVLGISDWQQSLRELLPSLSALIGVVVVVHLLNRWLPQRYLIGVAGILSVLAFAWIPPWLMFRAVPIVALGVLAWLCTVRAALRSTVFPFILICSFVLACLLRMGLHVNAAHYGFYLLPPAFLLFGIIFFRLLPDGLAGRTVPRREFRFVGYGFVVSWIVAHHLYYTKLYAAHNTPIDTPRGRIDICEKFEGMPFFGKICVLTQQILSKFPEQTRVLCIPQGPGLTFFSGRVHDFPLFTFQPGEMTGKYDDAHVVELLQRHRPEVIVKVEWPATGSGFRAFGDDYGRPVVDYIVTHYQAYTAIGPNQFIKIYVLPGTNVPKREALLELNSRLQ